MRELEIEQNVPFQYRHWRRERIGWVLIACVIAAGFFGIFGHHPLARATAQTVDRRLTVEYDRYARAESSGQLVITMKSDPREDGIIRLWFDAKYLNSLQVLSVSPLPVRGEARQGDRGFVFQSDGQPVTAMFSIQIQRVGVVRGRVKLNEGEVVDVVHMVWP